MKKQYDKEDNTSRANANANIQKNNNSIANANATDNPFNNIDKTKPIQEKTKNHDSNIDFSDNIQLKEQTIQKQADLEDEDLLQGKFKTNNETDQNPIQQKKYDTNSSIPQNVMNKMEGSFNTDFSNVNIHKNSQQATDVGALAFTQGDSVHFAPGQFKPQTQKGQELIGHEFAHVVQQREGKVQANKQIGKYKINDSKYLENNADTEGEKAARWEKPLQKKANSKNTSASNIVQRTSDKEYAKHISKADGLMSQVPDGQLVDSNIFKDITYESTLTTNGKAKNQIIKLIKKIQTELPIVYSKKNKLTVRDLDKNKLLKAQSYFYILRGLSQAWYGEIGDDPNKIKRAYGFDLFIKHTESLLNDVVAWSMQLGASNEEIFANIETASKDSNLEKVKKYYEEKSAKSIFTNLGFTIGKIAPTPFSSGELEVEVNIPIEPSGIGYLGGKFLIKAERDDKSFLTKTQITLLGGAKIPGIIDIKGEIGLYLESKGASPEQAMKLISYAFYKRMKQSVFKRFADFAWGGKAAAEKFAKTTEDEAFGTDSEAYVEMGIHAGAKGELGDSKIVAGSASAEIEGGLRYDKDTTGGKAGKGTAGFNVILGVETGIGAGEVSFAMVYAGRKCVKKELSASINSTKIPAGALGFLGLFTTVIGKLKEAAKIGNDKEAEGKIAKTYNKAESLKEKHDILTNLEAVVKGENKLVPTAPSSSSTKGAFEGSGVDGGLDLTITIDFNTPKITGSAQISSLTKYALSVSVLKGSVKYKTNIFKLIYDGSKWDIKIA